MHEKQCVHESLNDKRFVFFLFVLYFLYFLFFLCVYIFVFIVLYFYLLFYIVFYYFYFFFLSSFVQRKPLIVSLLLKHPLRGVQSPEEDEVTTRHFKRDVTFRIKSPDGQTVLETGRSS